MTDAVVEQRVPAPPLYTITTASRNAAYTSTVFIQQTQMNKKHMMESTKGHYCLSNNKP